MTVTVAFLYVGHEEAQMGRCLTRIWRGALTPLTLGLAAAFALVVAGAQDAGAQVFSNCTGAASVGPSISDGSLEIGQTASLSVVVQNTSFAPTMPTSTNVSSVVGGQTCNAGSCSISGDGCTVDADCETTLQLLLACGNNLCSTQLPGTLLFKAAAGNGCTSSLAAVDRCELDPADATGNTVNVVLKGGAANGIAFTPQQSQTIATFDVVAANPVLSNLAGSFFIIGLGDGLILRTNDALCVPDQFGTGSGTTTPTFPPVCAVKVDKQVACNGVDFVDAQLVTNNQDGTISCTGWNAFDNNPAEAVAVRYQGQNAGNLTLSSCTLMESNDQIPAGAPAFPMTIAGPSVDPVTFVLTPGVTTGFTTADTVCSETLVGNGREPNTATLACQCATGAPIGTLNASALDTAQINCLAPELNLTKKCVDTTIPPDGVDDAVEVTATNAGTASLSSCVVTDLLNRDDTDCSVGGGDPVTVAVNNFSLAAGTVQNPATHTLTGTIPAPPLAQNACDSASVTCNVDGAGKQATAEAPPVVCTGGVCAAEFDKQISCNGVDWVDVSIPVNGQNAGDIDDATNSQIIDCTSWNAYNDGSGTMPAEAASKRFVIDNTGTFNISCRVEDTVNGNTTVVVQTQEFAPGVHVIPLPDTCDAAISGVDSAVLVCECPQGELMHDNPLMDQAEITCQTPDLVVDKLCEDQVNGSNAITITVTNPAGTDRATLQNCQVTDALAPNCDRTIAGPIAPGVSTQFNCSVDGLTTTTNNTVDVTCEIVGANGKTLSRTAEDECEVLNCLTRTPGFWGTHAGDRDPSKTGGETRGVTQIVLQDAVNAGMPVMSCNLTFDMPATNIMPAVAKSVVEDMCWGGKDFKGAGTSPQQLQLIRQCTAANLNVAASRDGGGSCSGFQLSNGQSIDQVLAQCCGDFCTDQHTGQEISSSGCIDLLDEFNNSGETITLPNFVRPGPANATNCQTANGNGLVSNRPLGPPSGGGGGCGLGFELALLLPSLSWLRGRGRRQAH
jgi:hypothetical protein